MAVITSKQWRLNAYDCWKALIVAALSQPITLILTSLSAGKFDIEWKSMGIMAIGSAASYLLKNLATPSKTIVTNVSVPEKP